MNHPLVRVIEVREVGETVDRALAGDQAAVAELYRRFADSVRRYARTIVRDEHEAEDVMQQVFLNLLTSLDTYQHGRGSFQGWLLRCARNAALDSVRRRRSWPAEDLHAGQTRSPDSPGVAQVLAGIVAELPLRQRQVVTLLHLGLTPTETGQVLGLRENAVYVLYHRARAHLCPALERLGMAPSVKAA